MISPNMFRQRFAIATFADGGVLVDTDTGNYCRLNVSAAALCEAMENSTSIDEAITYTADRLLISRITAAEYIEGILTNLEMGGIRKVSSEPLRYVFSPEGGYDLCYEGNRILHVDDQGRQLRLIAESASLGFSIHAFIRHIVPKIASLKGLVVLHGSAVANGPRAIAMCGVSGAGKTTTAKILSKYERELIAEDLLVVAPGETAARIFKKGEQVLNEWSTSAAKLFESNRDAIADTSSLSTAGSGPTVELESIWLMDAGRRVDSDTLEKTPLCASEVLLRMLENSFMGAASWRHHLEMTRRLVATTESYEIKVPNTLSRLEKAIALQITNSAS